MGTGTPSSHMAQQDTAASQETGKASDSKQTEQAQQGSKSETQEKSDAFSGGEVSLGNISIGMRVSKARESLGEAKETKPMESSAQTRYRYEDVDLIADGDGVIIEFLSNSDKLSTPRGIKQGSPVDDVLRVYGKPAAQSERDGATLYEYHMTSLDHKPCLLRFSIKNSRVEYISGRLLG